MHASPNPLRENGALRRRPSRPLVRRTSARLGSTAISVATSCRARACDLAPWGVVTLSTGEGAGLLPAASDVDRVVAVTLEATIHVFLLLLAGAGHGVLWVL